MPFDGNPAYDDVRSTVTPGPQDLTQVYLVSVVGLHSLSRDGPLRVGIFSWNGLVLAVRLLVTGSWGRLMTPVIVQERFQEATLR